MGRHWMNRRQNEATSPQDHSVTRHRSVVAASRRAVETLESRCYFATFTVTTPNDLTTYTDGGPLSLRMAVSMANQSAGADTILLPSDTYKLTQSNAAVLSSGSQLVLTDATTIKSRQGPVSIQSTVGRILSVERKVAVSIGDVGTGLLFLEKSTAADGGAVKITNDASVTFSGVRFYENVANGTPGNDGRGGALFIDAGTGTGQGVVTIEDSIFSGDTARGGALTFVGGQPDDAGQGLGGGIYATSGRLDLRRVEFIANAARGGENPVFPGIGNAGGAAGGAMYLAGNVAATFDNTGIVVNGTDLRDDFGSNLAVGADGASGGGRAEGGAIATDGGSRLSIANAVFKANAATGGSAGKSTSASASPTAGGDASGGAIAHRATGPLQLTDVEAYNSIAQGGDGRSILPNSSPSSTLRGGNGGNARGGAVFASRAGITTTRVTIAGSGALGGRGGAAGGSYSRPGQGGTNGGAQGGGLYAAAGLSGTATNVVSNGAYGGPRNGLFAGADGNGPEGRGGDGGPAEGGGLYLAAGALTLANALFGSNFAFASNGGTGASFRDPEKDGARGGNGGTGGEATGGAIRSISRDAITLTNSRFSENSVLGGTGGNGGTGDIEDGDGDTGGSGGTGGRGGNARGGAFALSPGSDTGFLSATTVQIVNNHAGGGDGGLGGLGSIGGRGSGNTSAPSDDFTGGDGGTGGTGGAGGDGSGGAIWADGGIVNLQYSTVAGNDARGGWGRNGGLGGPGAVGTNYDFSKAAAFFGTTVNTSGGDGGRGGNGGSGGSAFGGGVFVSNASFGATSSSVVGNNATAGFGGDGRQGGNGAALSSAGSGSDGSGGNGGSGGRGGNARGGGVYNGTLGKSSFFHGTVVRNTANGGGGGIAGFGGGQARNPTPLYPSSLTGYTQQSAASVGVAIGGAAAAIASIVGIGSASAYAALAITTAGSFAASGVSLSGLASVGAASFAPIIASLAPAIVAASPLVLAGAVPVAYYGIISIGSAISAAVASASGGDAAKAFIDFYATFASPSSRPQQWQRNLAGLLGDPTPDRRKGVEGTAGTQGADGNAIAGGVFIAAPDGGTPSTFFASSVVAKNAAVNKHLNVFYDEDVTYTTPDEDDDDAGDPEAIHAATATVDNVTIGTSADAATADVNTQLVRSNGRNIIGVADASYGYVGTTPSGNDEVRPDQIGGPIVLSAAAYDAVSPGIATAYYVSPFAYNRAGTFLYSATDQLGNNRSINGGPDIGAVERPTVKPLFTKGPDVTANPADGKYTAAWATDVIRAEGQESSPNPPRFELSGFNAALFDVAPAVSANGTLTFTPKAGVRGSTTVTVVLRDVIASDPQTFTITLKPTNVGPKELTLSNNKVAAGAANGTTIGTLSATDPGDTLTYTLTNDAAGRFEVVGNQLRVKDGTRLTATEPYQSVGVRVVDSEGQASTKTFFLSVLTPVPGPANLVATPRAGTAIGLTWSATPNSIGYEVYRGTASGKQDDLPIATITGDTAAYVDADVNAGSRYYYTVRALFTGGTSGFSAEASAVAQAAPRVTNVTVSSTGWSGSFLGYLRANNLGDGGYALPRGTGQLAALPWTNVNQIKLTFDQNVTAGLADLSVPLPDFSVLKPTGFTYDTARRTATWTFAQPLPNTATLLDFTGTIRSALGDALDGEWTDGSTNAASGDGVAGGAFVYRLTPRAGDVNGDGTVNLTDVNLVKSRQTASTTKPASYSVLLDVNGDGNINASDTLLVNARRTV